MPKGKLSLPLMLFTRSSAVAGPCMVSVSELDSLFSVMYFNSCIIILRFDLMHNRIYTFIDSVHRVVNQSSQTSSLIVTCIGTALAYVVYFKVTHMHVISASTRDSQFGQAVVV
jgi:hypothetical protein